jgi:cyclic beta-1,2-glucan synthetase
MNDTVTIPNRQKPLSSDALEHLHQAARAAASWNVVHRPISASTFPARVRAAQNAIKQLEKELASPRTVDTATGYMQATSHSSALADLRENYRLLRSAINGMTDSPRVISRLPRIVLDGNQDEPRAAATAGTYLGAVEGDFSVPTLRTFIEELQVHEPLIVGELWSIPAFLKFALLELLLDDSSTLLSSSGSDQQPRTSVLIRSLRSINDANWVSVIEPLITFDALLRGDPAESYSCMDFESRESYRKRIAFIAQHSDYSETQVAQEVLDLAREGAQHTCDDPRLYRRQIHVGYYLLDKGLPELAARVGFHPPPIDRIRNFIRSIADDFYVFSIQIITVLFIAIVLFPLLPRHSVTALAIAVALLVLPIMQDAVELVNNTVTTVFGPQILPKLDFSKGIPPQCTTIVAVPVLLLNEEQVRKLVVDLEVRFLANRDSNLHFALLTDLPDSLVKPHENDAHPLVELAIQLINELNANYTSPNSGSFLLLHRHRIFNARQGVWMGWERKRGKLLDLNKLIVGEHDAFPIKAGPIEALDKVRYILTLDSDTQLPRGTAAQLVGAIAHPLNQAVIDPKLRIVTEGYGILQPRVGITVHSASRSRLAAIYSGQSGFDIYTRAVSDAYQDLFGEGSFTGKGIYEVAVFNTILNHRFPRNALLSHDLIEGAYTRAGLVTDIELIDDYPSHYSAYIRRKHRWVRGDWQIVQWMFSPVPVESGRWAPNPISFISRWKIFDNLRRSLVEPFTFILFVAGWLGLPGGPLYWTVVLLLMLTFPAFFVLAFGLGDALVSEKNGGVREAFVGFWKALLITFLNLIFLPHQTLLSLDAIVRSLVRRFVTGKRLLEWETAAQTESHSSSRTPVDRYLTLMPYIACGLGILVYLFAPQRDAILFAAPALLLWAISYIVTMWLNKPPREPRQFLSHADEDFLLDHALRTWRYFYQFGDARHNYLIPDNVEEERLHEAARVSPTNLGLLLNARQAACQLGFLTAPEFLALTDRTLATVAKLKKHFGHLYNWYDTQSLEPLPPLTVSSVDSGNFVASLYTVRAGALALCRQPLLARQLFTGIRAYWQQSQSQAELLAPIAQFSLPSPTASVADWIDWLIPADAAIAAAVSPSANKAEQWWLTETRLRIAAILSLICDYAPWLLPEYKPLRELPVLDLLRQADTLPIDSAATFSEALEARLAETASTLAGNSPLFGLCEQLRASLPKAAQNLRALASGLHATALQAEKFAEETHFTFLVNPDRRMLSIGYDVTEQKLHPACYDMLASEARLATFLAVARGDLSQQGWLNLGRTHTRAFNRFLLLSWSGTMFEYLMPALWMRSYPDTLIARTLTECVQVQRAFARSLNIPWGISESGFARKDDAGHYQYSAFGIPQAALKFDADAGPTVSPYSTFLALNIDSREALRNLRRMADAGWVGAYGFYEAADYANSTGPPVIVREWMAHHLGMSLLAILNLLHGNIVQRWFHANPLVQSAELILNELPARNAVLEATVKEFTPIRLAQPMVAAPRRITVAD